MAKHYAIICPQCKQLINRDSSQCPNCGMVAPGKLGALNLLAKLDIADFAKGLIGLNLFFFALSLLLSGMDLARGGIFGFLSPSGQALSLLGWAHPYTSLSGSYWQLISACFLHGGIFHILMNVLWIRDLSGIAGNFFSTQTLIIVYVFSGITGNVLAMWVGGSPVVGASGAIFGLMGAIIAFGYLSKSFIGKIYMAQLGKWALILLVLGFIIPGISNSAHIGGLIGGMASGVLADKLWKKSRTLTNLIALIFVTLTLITFGIMLFRIAFFVLF